MKKNYVVLTIFVCILFFVKWAPGVCSETLASVIKTPWPLTGQELLLDIIDSSGRMTPGIYSLSVGKPEAQPHLLIPYGSHPKWSWHHKKFVYYFNGDIWLCDLNGNKASLFPFPAQSFEKGYSDAINWSMDGKLLFTIHSAAWGSKVFVGPNVEETLISVLKKRYTLFFSAIGSGVFGVIPYGKRSQTGITEFGGDLSWNDVITTNNPSFSPDGLKLAIETYPPSPEDIKRKKSRILLYDMYQKAPNEKAADKATWLKEEREHFYISNFIPPFKEVGEPLTKVKEANTELKPVWSPDGVWIAYTEALLSKII